MKKTFIMYNDWIDMIMELDEKSQSELLRAIMCYQNGMDLPEMGQGARVAFAQMRKQFRADNEKYQETVQKRSMAGKASAQAKANKSQQVLTHVESVEHTSTNSTDTVNVNDNVNDNDTDNENVNVNVVLKNENNKKENVLTDIREKPAQEQAFDQFWNLYPKKKSKGQAKRAWDKLKPDQDTIMAIMAKLPELIASDDWRKDGGQYIPYPATWLNAEGWKDEVERPLNKYEEVDRWAQAISQF